MELVEELANLEFLVGKRFIAIYEVCIFHSIEAIENFRLELYSNSFIQLFSFIETGLIINFKLNYI